MTNPVIKLVRGDNYPTIMFSIIKNSQAVDLSGDCTVRFKIRTMNGVQINEPHDECTITNATAGFCTYVFSGDDLKNPGDLEGEVQVTFPEADGVVHIQTSYDLIYMQVRDSIRTGEIVSDDAVDETGSDDTADNSVVSA